MKTALIATIIALALTTGLAAQDGLPKGRWWHHPGVAERLGLTAEQRERLDTVSLERMKELVDLRADVEKRSLDLRQLLDSESLDRRALSSAARRLSEARAALFEKEVMLMVDLREVLTDDQWNRFRRALHERGSDRPQRPRRNPPPPRN